MNETEIERMVVRLLGDGTAYANMMKSAEVTTKKTMTSVESMCKRIELAQKALEGFGRGITQIGQGIRGFGTLLSVFITAPLTGLGYLAQSEFTEFEAALSRMEGLVGIAADEVKEFRAIILSLAGPVAKSPIELAKAMEFITGSGIKGKDALETLEITAKAASAGLGETVDVANAVTSAMNAYGPSVMSATKATDILVATVREGKAEASSFAPVFGQVLPLAAEMKISFGEVGGALAFLTRTTGNAAIATTQLRSMMTQLMKPTEKGQKALEAMGITSKDISNMIAKDGLIATVQKLKVALEKGGLEMKDLIGDTEGLMGALQFTGPQAKIAAEMIDKVNAAAGDTQKAFDAAAKTAKFSFAQAMAETKTILIELGEIIAPFMQKFISLTQTAITYWKQLNEPSKKLVISILSLAVAVGPILVGFGTLVSFLGTTIIGFTAIAAAIPTVTYGLLLVVGALYDIRTYYNIISQFVDTTKVWGNTVDWLGKQWQNLINYVKPAIEGIKNAIEKGDIQLAVDILWVAIKIAFSDGVIAVTGLWSDFKYETAKIWKDISNKMVIEWFKAVDLMELKQREFIAFMTGSKVSDKFKLGQLKSQSDLANKLGAERGKVLGGIRGDKDKTLAPMHAEANKLRDKMKYLTDLAKFKLTIPGVPSVQGPEVPELHGVDPNKPIVPPEIHKELDKLQEKAHIKIDMKFDAAAAGSAEAASRISEYMSNVGVSPQGMKAVPQKKKNYGMAFAWEMFEAHGNQENAKEVQNNIDIQNGAQTWEQMKFLLERAVQALEKPKAVGDISIIPSDFV